MRIPVAFDGCFGWLHTPPDGLARDTAVLLCPGILKDAMLAHCSWRLLADRLAEAGYTTLRFDYPGTGDSCDEQVASAGGHWPAWRASIERAADWLKSVSGARRLVLGGLRLGASLATLTAAQRRDVEGLLLFEPVTNGRTYLRQLVLEAELVNGAPAQRGQGIELRELSLSPSTLDDLQKIDLRVAALPARLQVAVFARTKGRALDECAEAWRQRGVAVALRQAGRLRDSARLAEEHGSEPDLGGSHCHATAGSAEPARLPGGSAVLRRKRPSVRRAVPAGRG
jgi:pimeloyl-ACP methyl ester carboxylesterase